MKKKKQVQFRRDYCWGLATAIELLRAILPVFKLTSAVDYLEDFQKEVFLGGLSHLMVNPTKLTLRILIPTPLHPKKTIPTP